jgi:starch synthase
MAPLSPLSDTKIARRYGARTLEGKIENKTALQRDLGWPMEPKMPLLCLPMGMSDSLGGTLFKQLLPGIFSLPLEILVLGKGSQEYGAIFTRLSRERGHRTAIVPTDGTSIRRMYAAADMALFLTDPTPEKELAYCLQYGVVPIALETKCLADYNPIQETGDAFLFEQPTMWHAFAAIVRAIETYKFPFDWRTIQRHGMESTHA